MSAVRLLAASWIFLVTGIAGVAANATLRDGNARVVFVGDSSTGQGGGWQGTGYVFKIREALNAVYPGAKPDASADAAGPTAPIPTSPESPCTSA
jgi:hypothetical protein